MSVAVSSAHLRHPRRLQLCSSISTLFVAHINTSKPETQATMARSGARRFLGGAARRVSQTRTHIDEAKLLETCETIAIKKGLQVLNLVLEYVPEIVHGVIRH